MLRAYSAIGFARPGGEASASGQRTRPVDLAHLARQTMGDRDVERQVLALFVQQAASIRDRMAEADDAERLRLAHALKGSARGIGAFAVAECAADIEASPEDSGQLARLDALVDEVRNFVAAISR
jgi:HPt (histidine-containing phosphotransfer) domain-containing protein